MTTSTARGTNVITARVPKESSVEPDERLRVRSAQYCVSLLSAASVVMDVPLTTNVAGLWKDPAREAGRSSPASYEIGLSAYQVPHVRPQCRRLLMRRPKPRQPACTMPAALSS